MLELDVWRLADTGRSVPGELWWNGRLWMYTLEPSRLTPVHPGHPCISAGRFRAFLTRSPHLGYITPLLQNVPGRSEIRVHKANRPDELLGCTAVGEDCAPDSVGMSGVAFKKLMIVLEGYTDIFFTYHDSPPPGREETNGGAGIAGNTDVKGQSSPGDTHS